jgi:hypothetical protein
MILKMWRRSLSSGTGPGACLLVLWSLPKNLDLVRLVHLLVLESKIWVIILVMMAVPSLLTRYLKLINISTVLIYRVG